MSKINMTNGRAMAQGYTCPSIVESDEGETLRVLLRDDVDTSGLVKAWDTEAQCWIELNGAFWTFVSDFEVTL